MKVERTMPETVTLSVELSKKEVLDIRRNLDAISAKFDGNATGNPTVNTAYRLLERIVTSTLTF